MRTVLSLSANKQALWCDGAARNACGRRWGRGGDEEGGGRRMEGGRDGRGGGMEGGRDGRGGGMEGGGVIRKIGREMEGGGEVVKNQGKGGRRVMIKRMEKEMEGWGCYEREVEKMGGYEG